MGKVKNFIFLHLIIFLYSLSSLCSKFASRMEFFSFQWCALYALLIFILGVYAILWQQLLKVMPLNLAYANKAVTLLWGMLFGVLVFQETVSLTNILGGLIVLAGVIVMVTDRKKTESAEKENTNE